jgi:hypothetical protein
MTLLNSGNPMPLDTFLASLMRATPHLTERLKLASITRQHLDHIRNQAKEAGFLEGHSLNPDDFVTFFGKPKAKEHDRWRYELVLWPEHYYELRVTESGRLLDNGFVLKKPDTDLPSAIPPVHNVTASVLRPGFHTQSEVQRVIGRPAETLGWNAMEDWFYGPVAGGEYLVMEFDFALLGRISQRPFIALPQ